MRYTCISCKTVSLKFFILLVKFLSKVVKALDYLKSSLNIIHRGKVIDLGDLKAWKSTGTGCQIEIHIVSQTSKFLIEYNLLRLQISGGNIITKFQQVS